MIDLVSQIVKKTKCIRDKRGVTPNLEIAHKKLNVFLKILYRWSSESIRVVAFMFIKTPSWYIFYDYLRYFFNNISNIFKV